MRENKQGSALIWAIAIIMVLMVTAAAATALSFSYYNRSLINNSKRQAYIASKTVVTNMVEKIVEGKDPKYLSLIPDGVEQTTNTIEIKDFPATIGTIKSVIYDNQKFKEEGKYHYILTISVYAEYDGQESYVNAELKRNGDAGEWDLLRYFQGQIKSNVNIARANSLDALMANFKSILMDSSVDSKTRRAEIFTLMQSDADAFDKTIAEVGEGAIVGEQSVRNDTLREYVFYGLLDGKWPTFDKSIYETPLPKVTGTQYIKFFFSDSANDNSNFMNYVIYTTSINGNGGWDTNLLYYQGHWYYSDTKFNLLSLKGKTATEVDKGMEGMLSWISSATKID